VTPWPILDWPDAFPDVGKSNFASLAICRHAPTTLALLEDLAHACADLVLAVQSAPPDDPAHLLQLSGGCL
jgi:hypothetical protein